MTGHGSKFGRKKEEAIAALLTQRNVEDAARSIGVAPKTLLRWMKQPEFEPAYRAARRDAFKQSIARLQQATSAAVTTLLKVMVDPGTPASTKVRAADSVLDHAAQAIEIEDIEARLTELERAAEASGSGCRR
jgi:transposase-like protein